jgi:predicted nucleotidyltransferase
MVPMRQIRALARRIAAEFKPEKVILFGSHATGTATADSDVDLFIVRRFRGDSVRQSVAMQLKLRPAFPVDLIVRSPSDVRRRLLMGDTFVRDILGDGLVLYDAGHS